MSGGSATAPEDEKMGGESATTATNSSSRNDREGHQQPDDPLADAASFPSLEEQNRQLCEARASLQQQQERHRLQQQQQQQQEQITDTGVPEAELEPDTTDYETCSYCGVSGTDILLCCATCDRYFCNSGGPRRGGGPSHIVHHLVKSKHKEVRFHPLGSLGETKLECFVCGVKNVLQLGMVIAKSRGVVVIVCRDKCYAGGVLEENGWDATQWQPLIEKKAFAYWLVRPLTSQERNAILPVSRQEMDQLEERWAKDGNATIADIRTEGNEPLGNAQLIYEDGISYQRIHAPLIQAEADVNKLKKLQEIAENVIVDWDKGRFNRIKSYFILEDDRFSGGISVGEELRVFCKIPRALLRPFDNTNSSVAPGASAASGTLVDTVTVEWSAKVWVAAVNRVSGLIEGIVISSSHGKIGPWGRPSRTYSVQCIWNPVAYERMTNAINSFAVDEKSISPYLFDLLLGRTQEAHKIRVEMPASISAPNLPPLNHSQIEAVQYAMEHAFTLIQGPPGTGKTLTAATLVYQLWATKPKGNAILIAAPSNVAVDNLAERIHITGLKVVRVYSKQRERAFEGTSSSAVPLEHLALHKLAENSPTAKSEEMVALRMKKSQEGELSPQDEKRLRVLQFRCETEVLMTADVVCCTCIGAGDRRIASFDYKTVVIDESTQATEPETLVPLVLGASHVVLIGDHRQMGPVLTSKRAQASGLGVSLFVRMLILRQPSFRLSVQYRMHPGLSYFPSQCYYDGSLQNGVTSRERTFRFSPRPAFKWPCDGMPSFFYHCTSEEELSSTGTSYVNRGEASVVERLIIALLRAGATPDQIGVITPYIGQRNYLKTVLQRNPMGAEIELSSVDAFQGREKDIVIFSCVRSNIQNSIGFLSDPRRLNVALTRARFCLFICGNADLLSIDRGPLRLPPHIRGDGDPSSSNLSKGESKDGPCRLLQIASAEYLQDLAVWPLLLLHYCKKNCIVTGPICNLHPVTLRVRRGQERNASNNAVMSSTSAASTNFGTEDITRLPKVQGAWPDYPLPPQEVAEPIPLPVPADDDGGFTASRFDI